MTPTDLEAMLAKNPALAARNKHLAQLDYGERDVKTGAAGVSPAEPKRDERAALDHKPARKAKDGPRFEIVFRIYAVRPTDWDNWYVKLLQDMLVRAGILHDDHWRILEGRVISEKAKSQQEERTEIEIRML